MVSLGRAPTVGELKKLLEKIPDDKFWYGWDDGSLLIVNEDKETDEGYIENMSSD